MRNRPDRSQIPTPNIQVSTGPRTERDWKLETMLVSIRAIPSLESRLYTSAVSPVAGLTADRPMLEQIQDARMMMTQNQTKKIIGLGILLPIASTVP